MKALAQLPYPIVFALTVGLFMGITVFLTEPIWAAVGSGSSSVTEADFCAELLAISIQAIFFMRHHFCEYCL